ncbi:bifunctional glutamate/proline--tRNA ligase-like [Drosophila kikkawai]|uniref:Bifunctional glutamate/proline--tRNA ligase-like n=1 Tax=Drosophila kikkawai TaxID=30033 RepID=A0ABM4GFM3_DROKI
MQDLEKAIQEQGDKVRKLKSSTKDKAVWQPEVNVLLELKKQLEAAQKAAKAAPTAVPAPTPAPAATSSVDPAQVKALEDKIAQQGEKVRTLKAAGNADVWKPEVATLLALKNELAALTGAPAAGGQNKGKKQK